MFNKILLFVVMISISGCNSTKTIPTPPPGWRVPVSNLFISNSSFPSGWIEDFSTPKDKVNDPTINHVGREWGSQEAGRVWQNIWRAHSVLDAEELYNELRGSQFAPNSTLEPYVDFEAFAPPDQIRFRSQEVDEYYFACGVWGFPYCEIVARYRNYVTNVHLPLKSATGSDGGVTYDQIEQILKGMDQQFISLLETIDQGKYAGPGPFGRKFTSGITQPVNQLVLARHVGFYKAKILIHPERFYPVHPEKNVWMFTP